jgi:hypothetical protein
MLSDCRVRNGCEDSVSRDDWESPRLYALSLVRESNPKTSHVKASWLHVTSMGLIRQRNVDLVTQKVTYQQRWHSTQTHMLCTQ